MRRPLLCSLPNPLLRLLLRLLLPAAALAVLGSGPALAAPAPAAAAPEFTHAAAADWLNSPPLTLAGLRGSVVLVDFWAFECWNCYRSFPWLNAVGERYAARGLRVIGVHTPELAAEHQRQRLLDKVGEYRLRNPIMIDNDGSYWRALGNQYWPAFWLIDRQGRVRGLFVGETHAGDANARQIEQAIETLLAEPG